MCRRLKNARASRSAVPEEAAFRQGFVTLAQLEKIVGTMPNCEYRAYLENEVVAEARRLAAIRA